MKFPSLKSSCIGRQHIRESVTTGSAGGRSPSGIAPTASAQASASAAMAVSQASQLLAEQPAPKGPVALMKFATNPPAMSLGQVGASHSPTNSLSHEDLLSTLGSDPALGENLRHWLSGSAFRASMGLSSAEQADQSMKIRQIANLCRHDSSFSKFADHVAKDANRFCTDRSNYFLNQLWGLAIVSELPAASEVNNTALLALGLSFMRLDTLRQKVAQMFDLSTSQSLGLMAHIEHTLKDELALPLPGPSPEFDSPQYVSPNTLKRLAQAVKQAQLEKGGAAMYKYLHSWQPWVEKVKANPVFLEEKNQLLAEFQEKLNNLEVQRSVQGSYLSSLNEHEFLQHMAKLGGQHETRVNELLYLHCQAMANVACELHLTPQSYQANYQENLKHLKRYNSSVIAAKLAHQRHLGASDHTSEEEKATEAQSAISAVIQDSIPTMQYFDAFKQGLYNHSILKLMESGGHIKGDTPRAVGLLHGAAAVTNAFVPFAGSALAAAAGIVNMRSEVSSMQSSQKFLDNLPATSGPVWDVFVQELSEQMAQAFLRRTEDPDFDQACFDIDGRYLHHFNKPRDRSAPSDSDSLSRSVRRAIEATGLSVPEEGRLEKRLATYHLGLVCDAISELAFRLSRDPKVAAREVIDIVFDDAIAEN